MQERSTEQPSRLVLFSEENSPFGREFLLELLEHPLVEVVAVVTQPEGVRCPYYDGSLSLAAEAQGRRIPLLRPADVNRAAGALQKLEPDYFLIANYEQILSREIATLPRRLSINFHPSPLPRYAGLRPFFWMAKFGERRSGVSAIEVSEVIDGGDIIEQIPVGLKGDESELEIRDILFNESIELLRRVVDRLGSLDRREFQKQDFGQRTYFGARELAREGIAWRGSRPVDRRSH